jgi:hypothetical protein
MRKLIKKAYENNLPMVTREGKKVEIAYIAEDCGTYSVVIRCKGELGVRTADGLIFEDRESDWDIVGLWEEKTYPIGSIFHVAGSTVMLTQIQPSTFKLVSLNNGNRLSERAVTTNRALTWSEIDFLVGSSWSYLGQFHEIYRRVPL